MNRLFFTDKFEMIRSRYPSGTANQIAQDIDFCADVFNELMATRCTSKELHGYAKQFFGTFYRTPENSLVLDVFRHFMQTGLSRDDIADVIIDMRSSDYVYDITKHTPEDSFFRKNSYIFRLNGEPRSEKFLKEYTNKWEFEKLFRNIVAVDDGRAMNFLKECPIFAKNMRASAIKRIIKYYPVPPQSKCYSALFPEEKESAFSYLNKLWNIDEQTSLADFDAIYDPKMAAKVGSEFFYQKLQNRIRSEVQYELVKRLINDGADWYLAFKQLELGHHAYLVYEGRERNHQAEVKDFIANLSTIYAGPQSVAAAVLKSLDHTDLINAIRTSTDAKKIRELTGDDRFLPYCTRAQRRNFLSSDLGL